MEFLQYMLLRSWQWVADNGLAIASLTILLILVPRIRRLVITIAESNLSTADEQSKGRRALLGAIVYIAEIVAYFVLIMAILSKFGIALTAAAIPATVVSAAVGFGAQSVIADFLGGVFIIAEKQYGIDDWVEFHAPSGSVQGDVVNITLRATTIRTLNGEEIIVPNSEARMCINYSSQWSRAVVEVPVPMTAGGSIKDLEERTVAAAERAISLDSVKNSVLSEIKLQSSTALNPPTVMGLPWTVTMRLVVDCKPGDQWLIERAIRASVIDTWWDDYGERAQKTPFDSAGGHTQDHTQDRAEPIEASPRTDVDAAPTTVMSTAATAATTRTDIPQTGANLDRQAAAAPSDEADTGLSEITAHSDWITLSRSEKVRRILSAGGRARVSTIILLTTLLVLGILNIMTVDNENGPSGWLAPSRWTNTTTDEGQSTGSSSGASSRPRTSETATTQPQTEVQDSTTSQPATTPDQPDSRSSTTSQRSDSSQDQQSEQPTSSQRRTPQQIPSSTAAESTDSTNNREPSSVTE